MFHHSQSIHQSECGRARLFRHGPTPRPLHFTSPDRGVGRAKMSHVYSFGCARHVMWLLHVPSPQKSFVFFFACLICELSAFWWFGVVDIRFEYIMLRRCYRMDLEAVFRKMRRRQTERDMFTRLHFVCLSHGVFGIWNGNWQHSFESVEVPGSKVFHFQ